MKSKFSTNFINSTTQVFECAWDKCDYQFEDPGDALEHATDSNGCVQRHFSQLIADKETIVYHCLWRNCIRAKRNQPPLPNIQRLIKHVREVHVVKAPGKIVQPQDRGRNYVSSTRKHLHSHNTSSNQAQHQQQQIVYHSHQQIQQTPLISGSPQTSIISHHQPVQQNVINYVTAPVEPLFVTVPPRPQRVLHSEAYIKYIEGLQHNTCTVGNYERTLKATRENVTHDLSRLPTQWLGARGKEKPEEVVDALWKLRNFMWRDALSLSKHY
jgi:protein polybromo-1